MQIIQKKYYQNIKESLCTNEPVANKTSCKHNIMNKII